MAVQIIDTNYQALWDSMKMNDGWESKVIAAAKKIIAGKAFYEKVAEQVNKAMRWEIVGVIHMMECSCSFTKHLHNGDSLLNRTTRVPEGRPKADPINGKGKPYTWIESAVDALKSHHFDEYSQFTLPMILYRLEKYNGFGYNYKKINTPYLWSGTNHYTKGKYVADGKFDYEAVSSQIGAALLFRYTTDKTLGLV